MSLADTLNHELATTAVTDRCGNTQGPLVCGRPATHPTTGDLARESHATRNAGELITWLDVDPADAIIAAPPAAPSAA